MRQRECLFVFVRGPFVFCVLSFSFFLFCCQMQTKQRDSQIILQIVKGEGGGQKWENSIVNLNKSLFLLLLLLKEKEKRNYYNRGPYIKGSGCCCCCCSFSFFFFSFIFPFSVPLPCVRSFTSRILFSNSHFGVVVKGPYVNTRFCWYQESCSVGLWLLSISISISLIYAFCDLFYVIPSFLIEHFVCVCVCVFNRGAFKY